MRMVRQENQTGYVVITPARDEAQYIAETIISVANQTIRPTEWVIVNDGSTDGTGKIIDLYAAKISWITPVHRPNRGFRENSIGAIETFFEGYHALKSAGWEFLVNLDADLALGPDYFERCFEEFKMDPNLGIGGGTLYHLENGITEIEAGHLLHVRGATKIYRRSCWEAMGGLKKVPGWDTIDEMKANMLGWRTRSFPNVKALHHRPTGAADGAWRDGVKNGQSEYFSGYHPLFMTAKCLKKALERPYFVGAAGLFFGFASAYLSRSPQVDDEALIRYVQKQQLRRLFMADSIWK